MRKLLIILTICGTLSAQIRHMDNYCAAPKLEPTPKLIKHKIQCSLKGLCQHPTKPNECTTHIPWGLGKPPEGPHKPRVPASMKHFAAGTVIGLGCPLLIEAASPNVQRIQSAWFCTLTSFFIGLGFEFLQRDGDIEDAVLTSSGAATINLIRLQF